MHDIHFSSACRIECHVFIIFRFSAPKGELSIVLYFWNNWPKNIDRSIHFFKPILKQHLANSIDECNFRRHYTVHSRHYTIYSNIQTVNKRTGNKCLSWLLLPLQYSHSKKLKAEGLAEWYFTHVKVNNNLKSWNRGAEGMNLYPTVSLHPLDLSAKWLQNHYCPPVISAHAEHFLLNEH